MPLSIPVSLHGVLHADSPPSRDAAWESFVKDHSLLLLKVARTNRRAYDDALDRYAYMLEKLREHDCRRLRAYQPGEARFTTWLVVVARRLCTDFERERFGRFRDASESLEASNRRALADLSRAAALRDDVLAGSDDPSSDVDRAERDRLLGDAVNGLPAEDRLIVRLRYHDGASVREVQEAVGLLTVFHVYRRLHAIHARLRDVLERRGLTDAGD